MGTDDHLVPMPPPPEYGSSDSCLIGDWDQDGKKDALSIDALSGGGILHHNYLGWMRFWKYEGGEWRCTWEKINKLGDYTIPAIDFRMVDAGILGTDNVPKVMIADGRSIALLKYVPVTSGDTPTTVADSFAITGWHWHSVDGWNLRPTDIWFAADIDGDHHNEIVVVHGKYFAIMREVANSNLTVTWFAENKIEGWNLRDGDSWEVRDIDSDGCAELIVTHGKYHAVLRPSGTGDALTIVDFTDHWSG